MEAWVRILVENTDINNTEGDRRGACIFRNGVFSSGYTNRCLDIATGILPTAGYVLTAEINQSVTPEHPGTPTAPNCPPGELI